MKTVIAGIHEAAATTARTAAGTEIVKSTFQRRELPKFSGEPRDYARFKQRWTEVDRVFSKESQLDFILEKVPRSV